MNVASLGARIVVQAIPLALAAIVLMPTTAQAKILCVNGTSGNDSTTNYANNNGTTTCWRTIQRAAWGSTNRNARVIAEAAQAGDVVRITPGTYNVSWNGAGGPLTGTFFSPTNNGTALNPIRFESSTGQRCSIVITNSGSGGPLTGANEKNYIQWADFSFNEATAPTISDTGPHVAFNSTGGSIENSCFVGDTNIPTRVGDNYNAIRVQSMTGYRIFNNDIRDYGGDAGDENHTGITTYTVTDIVVEHNLFQNCGTGFYQKGMANTNAPVRGAFTTRFNVFVNNIQAVRTLLVPSTNAAPNLVYQNIMVNHRQSSIMLQNTGENLAVAKYAIYLNNTIVNTSPDVSGMEIQGNPLQNEGNTFWNNIIFNGGTAWRSYTNTLQQDRIDAEHNLYFGYSTFLDQPGSDLTLAQWQSTYSQDSLSPAGITANPRLANPAGGDYRLCTGAGVPHASCTVASPALTLGRAIRGVGGSNNTVIPAGAYITGSEIIGLTTGGGPVVPAKPTNLRITPP